MDTNITKAQQIIEKLVNTILPELKKNEQLIFTEQPSNVVRKFRVSVKINAELRSRLPSFFNDTELPIALLKIGVEESGGVWHNYYTEKPEFKIEGLIPVYSGGMRHRRFTNITSFLKSANEIFTQFREQEIVRENRDAKWAEDDESKKKFLLSNLEILNKELSSFVFIDIRETTALGKSTVSFNFKEKDFFRATVFEFQNNEVTFAGGKFSFDDFKNFLKELKEKSI